MVATKCDAMTLICFGQQVIHGAHPQPVLLPSESLDGGALHMDISEDAVYGEFAMRMLRTKIETTVLYECC